MGKKIPQLTVQLIAAIAISLTMVMVIENYFSIRLSEILQIQFTFIPKTILGAVAGPVWAAIAAGISDPVVALMGGQPFIFTWIFIEAVSAFIYGWFYYQKPLDVQNKQDWLYVAGVVFLIQLVISFVLTPLALHIHYGTPWIALYSIRLVKAVFEIPFRILVTMLILPALQRIPDFRKLMGLKK
ncbi:MULTISPECIES: folate family ECF transporter S component [Streptococcus]|uniref:Folate family ECF transporter S component n=1 Tax=Streptococcus ruminantium TaxID=1917441 RepID=A0ABU1B3A5_9STRE|nr:MULTISPECIES: folate family ECF transporter S component [Streptococcus]MDQ8759260.1 folate family ECF transporter S component [Streptococcus ruminantium]MDQ8764197.1 folate family ECF transporter S component [Streptococcus ruminantium]MDQ8766699.1 folate family ECF transporter S component [Streptococcus ruminantium]MDQ8768325.1 folate family ECF transporter S component [Streptococcus ruminantium]MDQ8775284.1 folate family ECF transporter S component [Streptococcus ruminantium]